MAAIVIMLLGVVLLAALAQRLAVPYPLIMLASGTVIALIPWVPAYALDPHLALVLFLPPVLFEAAYFTSLRAFRMNLASIAGLAIGGVFVTMLVVGVVAKLLFAGMPWAVAFTLGAIVSPPDAIAASTILRRVGAPHRILVILEGESLVNDSSALTAYRVAITATTTGVFSLGSASVQFTLVILGGIAFGLVSAWLVSEFITRLKTNDLEIATLIVAPFAIYVTAERLQVSGVLAVVAAGMYVGRHSSRTLTSESRVGSFFTFQTGLILLNGMAFVLMGMQLQFILSALTIGEVSSILGKAVLIGLAAIVARFLWVVPATTIRVRWRTAHGRPSRATAKSTFLIGWAGLRGIVTLSAAMALPYHVSGGGLFPFRDEIMLISFVVIVMTLFGQGLFLSPIIRWLGMQDRGEAARDVWRARRIVAESATLRLSELAGEPWVPRSALEGLMRRYELMVDEMLEHDDPLTGEAERRQAVRTLLLDVNQDGRVALREAARLGVISDQARGIVEAELDRELIRMDA